MGDLPLTGIVPRLSLPAWWALPLGQGTESTQPAQQWGDTAWLLQSIILYAKLYIREESL